MKSDKGMKRREGHLRMTFSLLKVIMMKEISFSSCRESCVRDFWGACSSQGVAAANKDMSQQTAKAGARQPSGKKVKEFNLQGVDGKDLPLSDYKGKKVYLKFWASWCSICLSTLGDTNDSAKAEEDKDYVVLSVCSSTFNGETSEQISKLVPVFGLQGFPVLLDSKGNCSKNMGFVLIHRHSLLQAMELSLRPYRFI